MRDEWRRPSFILHPSFRPPLLPLRDGPLDHRFIDGHDATCGGLEFQMADDTSENLAEGAGAETPPPGCIPGDGHHRSTPDLQVDTEAVGVETRGAEELSFR